MSSSFTLQPKDDGQAVPIGPSVKLAASVNFGPSPSFQLSQTAFLLHAKVS